MFVLGKVTMESVVLSFILSVALVSCSSGGGGGESDTIPEAEPSVTVLDVRVVDDTDIKSKTIEIDLAVADTKGAMVTSLTNDDFEVKPTDASLKTSSSLIGSPITIDQSVIPGKYSATFLLDQTGSMERNDPYDLRIEAVKKLFASLGQGSEIQLIAFANNNPDTNDEIKIPSEFEPYTDGFSNTIDEAKLDTLRDREGGATFIYDSLARALDETYNYQGANTNRAVIILTDGTDDASKIHTFNSVIAIAQNYKLPIIAIGLGDDIDDETIASLALQTGGTYTLLKSSSQLESVVVSVNELLASQDNTVVSKNRSYYTLQTTATSETAITEIDGTIEVQLNPQNRVTVPYFVN